MDALARAVAAGDRFLRYRLGQRGSQTTPGLPSSQPANSRRDKNAPSIMTSSRSKGSVSSGTPPSGNQNATGPTIKYRPHWIQPAVTKPVEEPIAAYDPTWLPPPSDPNKGIISLPPELLRQIILYLIYNPERPDAFVKRALLPFSSTSKALRAVSTEFLFWSMDLFEASFGLRHRVLPSNTILELFHDLIHPPVPSFIRSGVRRLLIRDRDVTALRAPEGQENLCGIFNRVENVRSIHLDGQFYRPLPIQAPFEIAPDSRLNETLGNLTFLNCDRLSPVFPCFLVPGRWSNLTRIEYSDKSDSRHALYPSPFACFEPATEPIFLHLSIFVFAHGYQHPKQFNHILGFIKLHRASLDRLSIISSGDYEHFNFNFAEKVIADDALGENLTGDHSTYGVHKLHQRECMRALWKCLPSLKRLRLLDLDVAVTRTNCAPKHMVRIPNLRGLNLRNESTHSQLQSHYQTNADGHPVTEFFNHIPCPSIGYSHGSAAADPYTTIKRSASRQRTEAAQSWFQLSKLPHARNFTLSDVMEGIHVWVSLDGGGVRDVRLAGEEEKKIIAGLVGGWSVREDAETNHRFASE